jgi:hypothetical protein
MSRFIKHTELAKEIKKIFEEAKEEITIVSPYIKLHPDIKKILQAKMHDDNFMIEIMYGKNEGDISKSLSKEDLEFFKEFKNVYIHYQENLHAKYYANEKKSIITSINLHEYSFNHNIEVGILLERKFFGIGGDNSMDTEAFEYFGEIFEKSKQVFAKSVKEKKMFFGLFSQSDGTEIHEDNSKKMYNSTGTSKQVKPLQTSQKIGFCIRTGEKIAFNTKQPFSENVFKIWSQYKNKDYKEKYCHFSGEKSNGATSFAKPILAKNWKQAIG